MNQTFNRLNNLVGWLTFGIATLVYALTAEPTGSLWDCGEFVSASYKLQVVHPPGAPLFLMLGRIFAVIGETFSSNPETIAYAINLSSGVCTAFAVLFIFWSTTILAKLVLVGQRGDFEDMGQIWAILGAGLLAGLTATFCTSIWFSAVEGEVYAMSLFFTGITTWASLRWYISEHPKGDRWLVFIAYMVGLSIGVHLLSLLVIPFVTLLYYFKNYSPERDNTENISTKDQLIDISKAAVVGGGIGVVILGLMQGVVIPQIPALAAGFDFFFVNSLGMGVGMGMMFFVLLLGALMAALIAYTTKKGNYKGQLASTSFAMVLVGFSTYGMIVLRANTNLPINMNAPADPYSLLSYLNREQYGDRPLLYGPHYLAQMKQGNDRIKKIKDVYRPFADAKGKVRYNVVDEKSDPQYRSEDMGFFPRLGHSDRATQYQRWLGHSQEMSEDYMNCMAQTNNDKQKCEAFNPQNPGAYRSWAVKNKRPTMGENISFFLNYQIGWMYVRYFMWNFVGRQNAQQGIAADHKQGNWISGIGFLDSSFHYDQSVLSPAMQKDKGRNVYYFIPLILGLMGMFFHFNKRPKEAFTVLALFLLTGIAIIIFLNQPPQEPRERDYAFAGSFLTFCIWVGLAVPLLYDSLRRPIGGSAAAVLATAIGLTAPLLMCSQNWDDHSRAGHYGARDYAVNFLESCAPNAIIFTYGDNDTYPLWYAQEVEGIRTDVRVVNFSLLAVDWYINQLRYKINKSDAIKMSISENAYRGRNRNYIPIVPSSDAPMSLADAMKYLGENRPTQYGPQIASLMPARNIFIPIDKEKIRQNKVVPTTLPDSLIVPRIEFTVDGEYLMKDEIALLDIISTNAANGWERPIYFAVTCRPEKIMGIRDYLQLEGMGLRIVPVKTLSPGQYGAMGMGRVEIDTMYNNIMTKFRWGNFDKKECFIDESYMPSIHSIQFGMVRLASELAKAGQKEKTLNILDKFFTAFPHMNFPLDDNRVAPQIFAMYYSLDAMDKAKPHMIEMYKALVEKQNFFDALKGSDASLFEEEKQTNLYLMDNILQLVATKKDDAFQKELLDLSASLDENFQKQAKQTLSAPPPPNTPMIEDTGK